MNEDRGPWYLLTGLAIGIALGLLYSWKIDPVVYQNTAPLSLRADYKDRYRALVAAAYAANGNLARAQARLSLLGDQDPASAVALQAQQALAENRPEAEARTLGLLAVALSQRNPAPPQEGTANPGSLSTPILRTLTPTSQLATGTFTPLPSPSATVRATSTLRTPNPTSTPLPTRTPTPTEGAPFILQDIRLVCDARLGQPLIIIEAYDASGQPVPGAEVIVRWDGNEDHFFTGLKPELGLGYADFVMQPGLVYTLHLSKGGEPVTDLTPNECETSAKERFWGSWRLVFVQP